MAKAVFWNADYREVNFTDRIVLFILKVSFFVELQWFVAFLWMKFIFLQVRHNFFPQEEVKYIIQ